MGKYCKCSQRSPCDQSPETIFYQNNLCRQYRDNLTSARSTFEVRTSRGRDKVEVAGTNNLREDGLSFKQLKKQLREDLGFVEDVELVDIGALLGLGLLLGGGWAFADLLFDHNLHGLLVCELVRRFGGGVRCSLCPGHQPLLLGVEESQDEVEDKGEEALEEVVDRGDETREEVEHNSLQLLSI